MSPGSMNCRGTRRAGLSASNHASTPKHAGKIPTRCAASAGTGTPRAPRRTNPNAPGPRPRSASARARSDPDPTCHRSEPGRAHLLREKTQVEQTVANHQHHTPRKFVVVCRRVQGFKTSPLHQQIPLRQLTSAKMHLKNRPHIYT